MKIPSPTFNELVDGSLGAIIRHATQSKPLCQHILASIDHLCSLTRSTDNLATIQSVAQQALQLSKKISEEDGDSSLVIQAENLLQRIETQ